MQSHVQHISPVEVEIKVEYTWQDVQKDLDRTYQQLQRSATVRGFRKGKAPKHVLQQLYGDRVREQVSATLVEQGLLSVVQEHGLAPVAAANVHPPHIKEGEPLAFTTTLEVQPKVDSVDTSSIKVERPEVRAASEEMDQELERLRHQHAELVAPETERAAQQNDVVTLDYTVAIDGTPHPELSTQNRSWELGSGRVLPDLETAIIGMKPGETKSIELTLPSDQGQPEFRGKKASFQISITELRQKRLPELDDEFAKDCGNFETLDALKGEIDKQLRANAEREAESTLRERLIDQLVEKNPIAVPPSLVTQQQATMAKELAELSQALGTGFQWTEEMQADLHRRAERKVRTALLFGALIKQQSLEISASDLDEKFQEIATHTGENVNKIKARYHGHERDRLMSQLTEERIFEYLKKQATIAIPTPTPSGDKES